MTQIVRLVLEIAEGTNFHLLDQNSSLVLQGKLDGVGIKTDPIALSSMSGLRLEIVEDLVWKMSHRNFQRMKASKALKLECFNIGPGGSIKSVGYIIINLKDITNFPQSGWRRLLGSNMPSQSCPQLLLSVSLQDTSKPKKEEPKVLPLDKRVEEISGRPTELILKNGISYIGSEKFCKERFQFSCTLISATHLAEITKPGQARLQLKLLGQTLISDPFEPSEPKISFNKTFVFDIFSKSDTLVQYLNENPPVEVSILQAENIVSRTKHFLVIDLGTPMTTDIFFEGRNSGVQPKVTIAFLVSSLDKAEMTKETRKETEVVSPALAFDPSAPVLLDDDTEIEITSEYSRNFEMFESHFEKETPPVQTNMDLPARRQKVPLEVALKTERIHQHDFDVRVPQISDTERMTKVVEELEDWKLRQKILFTEELQSQKAEILRAWEDHMDERQRELEAEKLGSIEKSKKLTASLEDEIAKLKLKGNDLDKEEEKLKSYKKMMNDKLEEQSRAFKKQKIELESKITILVFQNNKLQEKVNILEAESSKVKKVQKNSESAEILELKEKLREMEQGLKKAQEEKTRVTKEWARSQRQVSEAKDQLTISSKNINREQFFPDQEKARLMQEKDLLEKLRLELLQMKQRPVEMEVINVRKLQEQRDALLKTGMYNEQSELVKSLEEAIARARNELPRTGED